MSNRYHLNDIITNLLGNKEYFSKEDYTLCAIALFGQNPSKIEIELIYKKNDLLIRKKFINIFRDKLNVMDNNSFEFNRLFHSIDRDCMIIK